MRRDELIPVIAQDVQTNNVLMVAWTNRAALARTRKTGKMHYWSRSRRRLWRKGEESGHTQEVVSLHLDCDRDTLLARVEQKGPACHRGTYSCFAKRPFPAVGVLSRLQRLVQERRRRPKRGSYTNRLLDNAELARDKVVEEAAELCMAAKGNTCQSVVAEGADLLYHALVLMTARGVQIEDVLQELERREKK